MCTKFHIFILSRPPAEIEPRESHVQNGRAQNPKQKSNSRTRTKSATNLRIRTSLTSRCLPGAWATRWPQRAGRHSLHTTKHTHTSTLSDALSLHLFLPFFINLRDNSGETASPDFKRACASYSPSRTPSRKSKTRKPMTTKSSKTPPPAAPGPSWASRCRRPGSTSCRPCLSCAVGARSCPRARTACSPRPGCASKSPRSEGS